MTYLNYNGEKIPYRIVKTNRKTISIRVTGEGVIVRAPRVLNNTEIMELVQKKSQWIIVKYHEIMETKPQSKNRDYKDGCQLLFRGKPLTLKYKENKSGLKRNEARIWREDQILNVEINDCSIEVVKALLEQWYREQARECIKERVAFYTTQYDFSKSVNRIFIKDQKSRWGSCSTKSNLNFSYRLIMAPSQVLDYVVVHELCHLKHMNHSTQFWSAVERILPNYKVAKEWLRKNGQTLYL